jgi:hypothetical protein
VDGIWQALCQVNFIFMAMNELVKNHNVSIRSRPVLSLIRVSTR